MTSYNDAASLAGLAAKTFAAEGVPPKMDPSAWRYMGSR